MFNFGGQLYYVMNHYSESSTSADDKLAGLLESPVTSVYLGLESGLLTLQVNSLLVNQLQLILYKFPQSGRTVNIQDKVSVSEQNYRLWRNFSVALLLFLHRSLLWHLSFGI